MPRIIDLEEVADNLAALVSEIAEGEEVIITQDGFPRAKLVGVSARRQPAHALGLTFIAPNFDEPDDEVADEFEGVKK